MDSNLVYILVALVLIVVAWKVFKGIVKTMVLAAILIAAAIFVFGGFA
ncbi:hypothetical protein KUV75_02615 [Qipengyuania gaetbuli]|nr:hypothetical protein [Qipengyuania gaetbuli]MBY6013795.1 hypothetical protein [Qipengyuania gaetbuli]